MTEQVRCRIDKKLAREFSSLCTNIGLSQSQAISAFMAQSVKLGGLPFRPSEYPALEEYGATVEDAEHMARRIRKELDTDRKAGKLVELKRESL